MTHRDGGTRLNPDIDTVLPGLPSGGYPGLQREGGFALQEQLGQPSRRKRERLDRVSPDRIAKRVGQRALCTDSRKRLNCIEEIAFPGRVRPEQHGQTRKLHRNIGE